MINTLAVNVWFSPNKLFVLLSDEREIAVSLKWFPSLQKATDRERNNWRLIGNGQGIHWEEIDEDISIAGLLKN